MNAADIFWGAGADAVDERRILRLFRTLADVFHDGVVAIGKLDFIHYSRRSMGICLTIRVQHFEMIHQRNVALFDQ